MTPDQRMASVRPPDVEGWLTEDQAVMLAGAASACPDDGQIVEIGSFRGLSTIVLARNAPDSAAIVTIDPHAGNDRGPKQITGYADEAAADRVAFDENVTRAGVRHRVRPVTAFSAEAHAEVRGSVDVLYIDGAHRCRPARADIRDWGRRVTDGGTLLIHDAFSSVGVTLAILRELVPGRRFRYVGRSRSLAEYRADLARRPLARARNGAAQLAQLGWFVRNVTVKLLLVLGIGRLLRRFGRPAPEWPY